MLPFFLISSFCQFYLLWNWLKIIETTSKGTRVGLNVVELNAIDVIINILWILVFLLLPFLFELKLYTETKPLSLLMINIVFAKFFWESILPSMADEHSTKSLFNDIVFGPIVNLISGIFIVKIFTFLIDYILHYFLSETIQKSMNFSLNFLSDMWGGAKTQYNTEYTYSIGLLIVVLLVLQMRIFPLYMQGWKKLFILFGVFTLILRIIKIYGESFSVILNIGVPYFKDSYSISSIILTVCGWLIGLMLSKIQHLSSTY